MESHIIDCNNILEVYTKVSEIAARVRQNSQPVLIEFKTFRIRGHEESSGTKYVPQHLLNTWTEKDPIHNFKKFLKSEGVLNTKLDNEIKAHFNNEINEHLEITFNEVDIKSNIADELRDVFMPYKYQAFEKNKEVKEIRFVDAISEGLKQSMEAHNNLIIMGYDIAEYDGVFKVTDGFVKAFGKDRVRNTPICESAIIETAMGLSIAGMKAVVEMQFADFASSGFNPIVNYLAKSFYRWHEQAHVVIRMPCGAGVGAGPFHSQTNEAWFTKTPGLKVVYPAFPADAKGLMANAINDPNPVLFFEHKGLYRNIREAVPTNYYTIPFGKASLIKTGHEVTIISYGAAVHWVLETLGKNSNIKADVIDLRTLQPLDVETIYASVKKTGRAIILQEDSLFGSIASDISALIMEHCFEYLDAPVIRVASLETPIPFAKHLEDQYLSKNKFEDALKKILQY